MTSAARREVRVKVTGLSMKFIYSDELRGLLAKGQASTRRVSHVEPAESIGWECEGWIADMSPVHGPVLFARTVNGVKQAFETREQALDAERAWLRAHVGV